MTVHRSLIVFPVPPGKEYDAMINVMNIIELYSGVPAPYKTLVPHLTFHKPIQGMERQKVIRLAHSVAAQIHRTRVTINSLTPFGKEHIVWPAHTTLTTALFWTDLFKVLSRQPEYEHGKFDFDNILHFTAGSKLTNVFDKVWPKVSREIFDPPLTIPLDKIAVYCKPYHSQERYECVEEILLPEKE